MNMNTTAHTIISSSIATGLALFTALSAAFTGPGSTATITGLSLFVAFGMIEIMIQSYATPTGVRTRSRDEVANRDGASTLVAFPSAPATAAGRKAA